MSIRKLSNEDLRIELECLSESLATCQDATAAIKGAPDDQSPEWNRVLSALGRWGDRLEREREKVREEWARRLPHGSRS